MKTDDRIAKRLLVCATLWTLGLIIVFAKMNAWKNTEIARLRKTSISVIDSRYVTFYSPEEQIERLKSGMIARVTDRERKP